MRLRPALVLAALLAAGTPAAGAEAPTRATRQMVAAAHPLAAQAGLDILRAGGSAAERADRRAAGDGVEAGLRRRVGLGRGERLAVGVLALEGGVVLALGGQGQKRGAGGRDGGAGRGAEGGGEGEEAGQGHGVHFLDASWWSREMVLRLRDEKAGLRLGGARRKMRRRRNRQT